MKEYNTFFDILKVQSELNESITKNWADNRTLSEIYTAMFVEIGEFIETTNFKWWKPKELLVENNSREGREELIDIFHFLLSFELLYSQRLHKKIDFDEVATVFTKAYSNSVRSVNFRLPLFLVSSDLLEIILGGVTLENFIKKDIICDSPILDMEFNEEALEQFFSVAKVYFSDLNDFVKSYYTKLVLNKLRIKYKYLYDNNNNIMYARGHRVSDNKLIGDLAKEINFIDYDKFSYSLKRSFKEILGI